MIRTALTARRTSLAVGLRTRGVRPARSRKTLIDYETNPGDCSSMKMFMVTPDFDRRIASA